MRRLLLALLLTSVVGAAPSVTAVEIAAARAVDYAIQHLAYRGGYVWWYAVDGSTRAGEGHGELPESIVWVQPPSTPTMGEALVHLWEVTADRRYLDAATQTGEALAYGQMVSGGWYHYIEFAEPLNPKWILHYLRLSDAGETERGKRKTLSTFDDDTTQSALDFMLRLDDALNGQHPRLRRATEFALDSVLAAQFPYGAWPQIYEGPVDASLQARPPSYPDDYRVRPRDVAYWDFPTLNDDVLADNVRVMLHAWECWGDRRCLQAAVRAGEFLLLSQLPEPHPIWAQQYRPDMQVCWARKFEPPAASSLESVGVLETLLDLWVFTADERFREPIQPAIDWLRAHRLPEGLWPRFYELGTARPLYMTSQYELTYDDGDLPTHYGFKQDVSDRLDALEARLAAGWPALTAARLGPQTPDEWRQRAAELAQRVEAVLAAQDRQGRWTTTQTEIRGTRLDQPREVIEVGLLADNLNLLADYLTAVRATGGR